MSEQISPAPDTATGFAHGGAVALACSIAAFGSETRSTAAPTLVVDNSFALYTLDPQR